MEVQILTVSTPVQIMAGTDLVDTTFPTLVPTATRPAPSATRAVIELGIAAGVTSNLIRALPYGFGADNAVLTGMRFWGWSRVPRSALNTASADLWVCEPLVGFDGVCGASPGVAGTPVPATAFFLDTITLTTNFGVANVNNVIQSNQADLLASVTFDAYGYQYLEMTGDRGANLTAFNALVRKL